MDVWLLHLRPPGVLPEEGVSRVSSKTAVIIVSLLVAAVMLTALLGDHLRGDRQQEQIDHYTDEFIDASQNGS